MNSQGKDTNTVLTNLSNYLTVVSDKPYSERKKQRYGLPALRSSANSSNLGRRGLRSLHKTTLNITSGEIKNEFCSTMKDSFGGKPSLKPVKQLKKFPSLHTSQFDVGLNSELHTTTTTKDCFTNYTGRRTTEHVDRARWMSQMAGRNMVNCTRFDGASDIDFLTTYSQNHYKMKLKMSYSEPEKFNGRWRTSIYKVCGEHPEVNDARRFSSISRNRTLHEERKKLTHSNILY
ncbi:uncharacterized protein LOC114519563 [Dendronephthya gigantea]|uniref:uncharacterized protein LOC114519563 n=1 Tax=Dendronephthya gigantea TaxID=151771 RepID=UPI00106C61FA|nr:uncharacterized protein LOC114519563 [Dendronephthya gigantea]